MAQHRGVWDDDTVAKLKKLAATGEYSATQIGRMLGVNRSQVLGKCHRLKISIVGNGARRQAIRRHTMNRVHKLRAKHKAVADKIAPPVYIEPLPLPRIEDVARKQLADLNEHECKYPVGHPGEKGFGFCALERVQGLPYCAQHAARCFVPIQPRKSLNDKRSDTSPDKISMRDGRILKASELASVSK